MGKYFVSVCLDVKVPRWVSKWARDALGRGVGGLSGGEVMEWLNGVVVLRDTTVRQRC